MMAIVQTVTESIFHDTFHRMGRAGQFSYEGRAALFEYLENLSDDMGEPVELDVIGLCCDFTEYTYDEIREAYDDAPPDDDTALLEWLRERTSTIEFTVLNHTDTDVPSVIVGDF